MKKLLNIAVVLVLIVMTWQMTEYFKIAILFDNERNIHFLLVTCLMIALLFLRRLQHRNEDEEMDEEDEEDEEIGDSL